MSNKVYLVDGSGYIFRAYHAVAPLSTKAGFPTNALFGFTRMLKRLLAEADSAHAAVVFDVGRETFRLELYPQYKANRAECPTDLLQQMPYFRDITRAFGLLVLEQAGYEADDIIATLTKRLERDGREVVIVSGDKDLMQLVSAHVTMWDTLNDRHFGIQEVREKLGVLPHQVPEFLALTGDTSDNVPGLTGVGPKTAAQLVEKFGDVERIIHSVAAVRDDPSIRNRKKIAEQLEYAAESLRLSRKLVEVNISSPVQLTFKGNFVDSQQLSAQDLLEALTRAEPRRDLLGDLVQRFEFHSLASELQLGDLKNGSNSPDILTAIPLGARYEQVLEADFPQWLSLLAQQQAFSFDLETTSLDTNIAQVVGVSFCWSEGVSDYLPFGHVDSAGVLVPGQVPFSEFTTRCGAIFSNDAIKKCGQNLKYDLQVLMAHGVEVQGVEFDTMLAAYLLKPDRGAYNLTVLANDFLGLPIIEFEDVVGALKDFSSVSIEHATRYACQDAHYAWLLWQRLAPKIEEAHLETVANQIEMPLVPVLARMERSGIRLDTELLQKMSVHFAAELQNIRDQIVTLAGKDFNPNSTRQLAEVLFEDLGLSTKGLKRTKTGISTDSSVLEKLQDQHPLPGLILHHRLLSKLKSTYIDALPAQVSAKTRRLHTRFNQTGTGTGRLSSSEPNLQNIPIQTSEGRQIRCAFIPADGCVLISADYSQIELRILAHLSDDTNLISAFSTDVDIHARTARQLLNIPDHKEVSPAERRIGKTINFGIIYGMGPFRLSRELGIPLREAHGYIEQYFAVFSGVANFFAHLEQEAQKQGFVCTISGRRRYLSDIDLSGRDKGFVLRAAMNAPLQGSAADLIKTAMVNFDRRVRLERLTVRMLLQIHDELVFECPRDEVEAMLPIIKHEMEGVRQLRVPLKVDIGVGKNWEEAHH